MSESNPDDETTTTVRRIGDPEPTETDDPNESASKTPAEETAPSGNADAVPPEQQRSLFDRDPEDIDPEEIEHLPETVQEAVMNPDSNYRGYFDTEESTDAPGEDTQDEREAADSASDDADDEDIPEPRTLSETGLVDEDGTFDWEDADDGFLTDSEVSFGEGDDRDEFYYNGVPFELSFPDDDQQLSIAGQHLEGLEDMREVQQKAARMRFLKAVAHACYTVRGVPLDQVYLKGKRPVAETEHTDYADDPEATPLWEAGTEADRRRLGVRANNFIEGATKFRPR